MALPKVCGIETEFGIMVRGAESNPVVGLVAADQRLRRRVNGRDAARTGWDFNDEQPGNDARGFSLDDVMAPEIETNLVNAVLTNGARYYVDHAHPEISTPETTTALEAVRWDRAAEEIIRDQRRRRQRPARPDGAAPRTRDRRPQEQLRRQGQQLRLPRELPAGAPRRRSGASPPRSRRTSSPARSTAAPARSAASCPARRTTTCRSSSASGPTSSKRRSASRPRSSARSSTPATSRTATPRSTAACT